VDGCRRAKKERKEVEDRQQLSFLVFSQRILCNRNFTTHKAHLVPLQQNQGLEVNPV
jgi:hypothetical protein